MDILEYLKEKSEKVNKAIEKYIPRNYTNEKLEFTMGPARFKYSPSAAEESISKPVWDLLDRGGKRWRPVLFLLTCEALGGDPDEFIDFVTVVEVLHNGSLIVDDIEDNSELRRGEPCIHKKFGVDIAVNAGNAMYFLPFLVLLKNKTLDKNKLLKAYEIYAQEMISIHFGQGMDIVWHKGTDGNVSEKEYLQMCAYKTGTLARLATKFGALFAGADEKTIEKIGKLGESIGIGFQIQDDVLNITADHGKGNFTKIGTDITEGKRTLIVIHALSHANNNDKRRITEILDMHTNDNGIKKEFIEIMKKHKSIDYAKDFSNRLIQNAWDDVKKDIPDNDAKDILSEFVKFAIKREY
jgi:geranylgeranyl pyrophosphate synthase